MFFFHLRGVDSCNCSFFSFDLRIYIHLSSIISRNKRIRNKMKLIPKTLVGMVDTVEFLLWRHCSVSHPFLSSNVIHVFLILASKPPAF